MLCGCSTVLSWTAGRYTSGRLVQLVYVLVGTLGGKCAWWSPGHWCVCMGKFVQPGFGRGGPCCGFCLVSLVTRGIVCGGGRCCWPMLLCARGVGCCGVGRCSDVFHVLDYCTVLLGPVSSVILHCRCGTCGYGRCCTVSGALLYATCVKLLVNGCSLGSSHIGQQVTCVSSVTVEELVLEFIWSLFLTVCLNVFLCLVHESGCPALHSLPATWHMSHGTCHVLQDMLHKERENLGMSSYRGRGKPLPNPSCTVFVGNVS